MENERVNLVENATETYQISLMINRKNHFLIKLEDTKNRSLTLFVVFFTLAYVIRTFQILI